MTAVLQSTPIPNFMATHAELTHYSQTFGTEKVEMKYCGTSIIMYLPSRTACLGHQNRG